MNEETNDEVEMGVIGSLLLDYEYAEKELHAFDLQPCMFISPFTKGFSKPSKLSQKTKSQ